MAIDKDRIIQETLKLNVAPDENGLIPFFGVYVQKLPVDFWNGFAQRIINNVPEDLTEAAEGLLINAARECAYHTAHGVIMSKDWTRIVSTMVRNVDDMLRAVFIAFSVWGWGRAEIIELKPKEKLVVQTLDYYERDAVLHGRTNRPLGCMMRGVCAAFMDLTYGPAYPHGIGSYQCVQTKGIELGDDCGEFVVTPIQ